MWSWGCFVLTHSSLMATVIEKFRQMRNKGEPFTITLRNATLEWCFWEKFTVFVSLLRQSITSKQRYYLLLKSKYWFLSKCRRRILNQSCDQACTYYPLEAPFWQIMTISQEFNVTLKKITKASKSSDQVMRRNCLFFCPSGAVL